VDDDQDRWLEQLSADARQHAQRLVSALQHLGCDDPAGWARSEIEENIPQLTKYRFLHKLWPRMINGWGDGIGNLPAAQRALQAGADPEDLTQLARAVAYDTVFAMLYHLDDDDPDAFTDTLPSWALIEIDREGAPTGRNVDALYEDLLTLDPSGKDGHDLRN
jgi:hypothetical protein